MTKLPRNVKSLKMIRITKKVGFQEVNKRGSHRDFKHEDGRRTAIAVHPKPIPVGTLRKILSQLQITLQELNDLL